MTSKRGFCGVVNDKWQTITLTFFLKDQSHVTQRRGPSLSQIAESR